MKMEFKRASNTSSNMLDGRREVNRESESVIFAAKMCLPLNQQTLISPPDHTLTTTIQNVVKRDGVVGGTAGMRQQNVLKKNNNKNNNGNDKNGSDLAELVLNETDMNMLSGLEIWGVLGLGQLLFLRFAEPSVSLENTRLLFNEIERADYWTRGWKRIRQLIQAGYIKRHEYHAYPLLFTLNEAGHRILIRKGINRLPGYRDSIARSLIDHELMVGSIGLTLGKLFKLDVLVERERFQWSGKGGKSPAPTRLPISDIWIADPEQPKAVEVELVQKSEARYQEIWEAYRRRLRPKGVVLYITGWPNGVECLRVHARRFEADHVFVCSLEDFKSSLGAASFLGYRSGSLIRLTQQQSEVITHG